MERPISEIERAQLPEFQHCLDFVNTVKWHASARPIDEIASYAALLDWARTSGLVDAARAQQLQALASQQPALAEEALRRARALREVIYRIFAAVAGAQPPAPDDLARLNIALAEALAHARIEFIAGDFVWGWARGGAALDSLLWPIARSAADLLTSRWRGRVGQCADDRGCGWLFIDTSKNHSRRWCDINDCGNRAKARRHYQRVRDNRRGA
jgi:predicted RNA-binding Zn ribbon-like protein